MEQLVMDNIYPINTKKKIKKINEHINRLKQLQLNSSEDVLEMEYIRYGLYKSYEEILKSKSVSAVIIKNVLKKTCKDCSQVSLNKLLSIVEEMIEYMECYGYDNKIAFDSINLKNLIKLIGYLICEERYRKNQLHSYEAWELMKTYELYKELTKRIYEAVKKTDKTISRKGTETLVKQVAERLNEYVKINTM